MRQQIILTSAGVFILVLLIFFGRTVTQKSVFPLSQNKAQDFNINVLITKLKSNLTNNQQLYVSKLENSIARGDVKKQRYNSLIQLATFWKDSINMFVPFAYYLNEASKLDNSEKNLTFAAQIMLDSMRSQSDPELKNWEAEIGKELFEKALLLQPDNDNLKIGLGSCYVYGKGMNGDPVEAMKGIQQLLQVVKRDSNNMKAQLVLGIGGVVSQQYDKAIDRLLRVVRFDGKNLEAVSWLADAYAAKNEKENAKKWYEYSKKLVNNQEYSKVVDERIKEL